MQKCYPNQHFSLVLFFIYQDCLLAAAAQAFASSNVFLPSHDKQQQRILCLHENKYIFSFPDYLLDWS